MTTEKPAYVLVTPELLAILTADWSRPVQLKVTNTDADGRLELTVRDAEDAKRLDWMEEAKADVRYQEEGELWVCDTPVNDECAYAIREAIDKARAEYEQLRKHSI